MDAEVTARLLNALSVDQVSLALLAADEVADRHLRVNHAAELAVERARYEADRAERSFHACEPENRLVARNLEGRWEARLAALSEAEQALEATRESVPVTPSREDLQKLVTDLPGLWHATTTSSKDRKRLLRTLVSDITVLPETDRSKVRIGIRWHTGVTDEFSIARPIHPGTSKRTADDVVELVKELGPTMSNEQLIEYLDAAGLRTGTGRAFDAAALRWVRRVNKIPALIPPAEGEASVAGAAEQLACSIGVIYYWIKTGFLVARRRPGNRLWITWDPDVEARCRRRLDESCHLSTQSPPPARISTNS